MTPEQRLRNYLEDHLLGQSPVARKAGISIERFNRILNNKTQLTADELVKISNALKVSSDVLIRYERDLETTV